MMLDILLECQPATACLVLSAVTDGAPLLLSVSTKLFILHGNHLLVHTEMDSQLPCKILRKSLLSTLIIKRAAEMALSTTSAFSLGQAVPDLQPAELTLPAERAGTRAASQGLCFRGDKSPFWAAGFPTAFPTGEMNAPACSVLSCWRF